MKRALLVLPMLLMLWPAPGCQLFDFRKDIDRSVDLTQEFVRKVGTGETKVAYGMLSREQRLNVSEEAFGGWASTHRREYEELLGQPDLGVRGVVRQGDRYFATVMTPGGAKTWVVKREGWNWVLELPDETFRNQGHRGQAPVSLIFKTNEDLFLCHRFLRQFAAS